MDLVEVRFPRAESPRPAPVAGIVGEARMIGDGIEDAMPKTYSYHISAIQLLTATALMVLPFAGGIKDVATLRFAAMGFLHAVSVVVVAGYAVWLWRFLNRRIEVGADAIALRGWAKTTTFRYEDLQEIQEVEILVLDRLSGHFDPVLHLVLTTTNGRETLLCSHQIRGYGAMRADLQARWGREILCEKEETTRLMKGIELLQWLDFRS